MSTPTQHMSKSVKKGVSLIIIGLVIVVIGMSLTVSQQGGAMVGGWILDIVGVAFGLYGFGYVVAVLKKR